MGNGGSSTRFQVGLRDPHTGRKVRANSKNSDSPDFERVPLVREEVQVRVRTKNNTFAYHKDSLQGNNMSRTIVVESDEQKHVRLEMKRIKEERIGAYKDEKLRR